MTQQHYELHPLCTLFPRMSGAEFDALRDDIAANGLRQSIVLVDGKILDGGNRYRACLDAGTEPQFTEFTGDNIVSFVLSANLHRRHMSAGQQAAIVATAQDWAKANTRGGDRKSDQSATLHFDSVEKRAAESGASVRTQKMADKVAKADPALAKQVAHGEVSLPKAAARVDEKSGRKPASKPAPTQVAPPAPAAGVEEDEHAGMDELLADLQAENRRLIAEIQAAGAEDQVAETLKWRRNYEGAKSEKEAAERRTRESTRREKFSMDQLRRCGRAVSEEDPRRIAAKVEAAVKAAKEAGAWTA